MKSIIYRVFSLAHTYLILILILRKILLIFEVINKNPYALKNTFLCNLTPWMCLRGLENENDGSNPLKPLPDWKFLRWQRHFLPRWHY